jgi:hypothetical protein
MDTSEKNKDFMTESGLKSQRVSMIAALNKKKVIAPLTFEGF